MSSARSAAPTCHELQLAKAAIRSLGVITINLQVIASAGTDLEKKWFLTQLRIEIADLRNTFHPILVDERRNKPTRRRKVRGQHQKYGRTQTMKGEADVTV